MSRVSGDLKEAQEARGGGVAGESLLQSLSQLHLQCGVFPAQILGLISSGTKIILLYLYVDIIYICCDSFKIILSLCLKNLLLAKIVNCKPDPLLLFLKD